LKADWLEYSVLMQAMDPDQSSRYSTMRRVKLKKETVRKVCILLPKPYLGILSLLSTT